MASSHAPACLAFTDFNLARAHAPAPYIKVLCFLVSISATTDCCSNPREGSRASTCFSLGIFSCSAVQPPHSKPMSLVRCPKVPNIPNIIRTFPHMIAVHFCTTLVHEHPGSYVSCVGNFPSLSQTNPPPSALARWHGPTAHQITSAPPRLER